MRTLAEDAEVSPFVDGNPSASQHRRWPALPQVDRTVMLNTVASWATIISAVPVAIAASSAR